MPENTALIADGGLATELEARGNDLFDALWSARLLVDAPQDITAVHMSFFRAGAMIATTASYQVSFDAFAANGIGRDETVRLLRRSVELAGNARDEVGVAGAWVAASVGPYGAALADGSEYRGRYGLSIARLEDWHRPRLEVLAGAGADVLALETIPDADEAEALVKQREEIEERLRKLLAEEDAVTALGALTGNQAVQQVRAGLKAMYLSGWQVAADAKP